jgi:hypothetical protein
MRPWPLLFASEGGPPSHEKVFLILTIVFLSLAGLVLGGTALWLTRELRRRLGWTKTAGEVVEHVEGDECTFFVITYRDAAGRKHKLTLVPPECYYGTPVGGKVSVRYDPRRPERSDLEPSTNWSLPLLPGLFFGVSFLFVGTVTLVLLLTQR